MGRWPDLHRHLSIQMRTVNNGPANAWQKALTDYFERSLLNFICHKQLRQRGSEETLATVALTKHLCISCRRARSA